MATEGNFSLPRLLCYSQNLMTFIFRQPDVIRYIINNSAGDHSISIKFATDYDHVIPDLPQTFKVNGQSSRS